MQRNLNSSIHNLLHRTMRSLQVDTDRSYSLEMNALGHIKITGITDIRTYDENNILVLSDKNVTEIKGINLFMEKFSDSEISVSGEISAINFIKR